MFARGMRVGAALLLALVGVVSCTGPAVTPAVLNVTIDDGEHVVEEGSTLALTVTVETRGDAIQAVLWSSDAPETATVSSTGIVTGVSPGEARITATSAFDASKADTVTITVTPPPVTPRVLSVSIDSGERSVLVGEELPLSATVITVGGSNDAVTWTSDDTGAATVSSTGLVSGITVGQALITATSAFDPGKSDSTFVSVVAVPPGAPARISVVTGDNQTAAVGSAVPVPPTVRVRDADENPLQGVSVTFAVTDGNGIVAPATPVTTNADGIAALSSWTLGSTAGVNGVRATVTGTNPPISTTFSATGLPGPASPATSTVTANPTSLLADGTATSELTIQLKDAYGNDLTAGGATVTFATFSQGSVGSVTDNGNGEYAATYTAGTTAGTVTITPRLNGVSFTNTTTITLTAAVLSVTIDQANPTIIVGDTLQLTATVATIGGASTDVTWSSSNTSAATIDPTSGLLTGVGSGTTTLTATSDYDPTKSGSTVATATPPLPAAAATDGTYVAITNLKATTSESTARVSFDIAWANSWRGGGASGVSYVQAPDNWDAVWLFMKFRDADGAWYHAMLDDASGPVAASLDISPDAMGVFIYRKDAGAGSFAAPGVTLTAPLPSNATEVRLFPVEVVNVPQGSFSLGTGGSEQSAFRAGATTAPFVVTSQSSIALGGAVGQLNWTTSTFSGSPSGTTNALFPTGFSEFYAMKFELTQGQYVSFLNTLTQTQADARKYTASDSRYAVTGSSVGSFSTSLPFVAMNYLSWSDAAAYADWAGLRPMTELEFEKAARGPLTPVQGEFAWGTTAATAATGLLHAGTIDETPIPDQSNANFAAALSPIGPVRVGSFASSGDTRVLAGASYHGLLEMSGNLHEWIITPGTAEGRLFDGRHGDGLLASDGNANQSTWPGIDAMGAGFRGGGNLDDAISLRVSDRRAAARPVTERWSGRGLRAARTSP